MPLFTDQLGRNITLDHLPQRIVSLVPSQTELLHSLGLQAEVAGITKFCVHPQEWFRSKTRIGGTKNIRFDAIHDLQPDLILANKEENEKEQIEELALHYPVWVSNIHTLDDALAMIRSIGTITGKDQEGDDLAREIARRFTTLADRIQPGSTQTQNLFASSGNTAPESPGTAPRTAYFIWRNPWMVAGGDTFIEDMLQRAGFKNVFCDKFRYPAIELESLSRSGCELILLSSEPYPFKEQHIKELRTLFPSASIQLVDGELFSWYGSRLLEAPAYFRKLRDTLNAPAS
jgi:ABC-type Fe3+-hydroxamate transport system substrate-binding protein